MVQQNIIFYIILQFPDSGRTVFLKNSRVSVILSRRLVLLLTLLSLQATILYTAGCIKNYSEHITHDLHRWGLLYLTASILHTALWIWYDSCLGYPLPTLFIIAACVDKTTTVRCIKKCCFCTMYSSTPHDTEYTLPYNVMSTILRYCRNRTDTVCCLSYSVDVTVLDSHVVEARNFIWWCVQCYSIQKKKKNMDYRTVSHVQFLQNKHGPDFPL